MNEVTYIATANERGQLLEVRVLASNATYPQTVGQYRTLEECEKAVEPFGQVTWVTPYLFQKEATCY
jgi:hypothetical protein